MMSYDQNMQTVRGRRLVFVPYPGGTDMNTIDCGGDACFFAGGRNSGCGKCTDATRDDRRYGWWREVET